MSNLRMHQRVQLAFRACCDDRCWKQIAQDEYLDIALPCSDRVIDDEPNSPWKALQPNHPRDHQLIVIVHVGTYRRGVHGQALPEIDDCPFTNVDFVREPVDVISATTDKRHSDRGRVISHCSTVKRGRKQQSISTIPTSSKSTI